MIQGKKRVAVDKKDLQTFVTESLAIASLNNGTFVVISILISTAAARVTLDNALKEIYVSSDKNKELLKQKLFFYVIDDENLSKFALKFTEPFFMK